MDRSDSAARGAIASALFLTYAGAVLAIVMDTLPAALLFPGGSSAEPAEAAFWAYVAVSFLHGLLAAAVLALLPVAAVPTQAGRKARLAARALALGVVGVLAWDAAAGGAGRALGLLALVPALALATALALRLPRPGARTAALAATGAIAAAVLASPMAATPSAALSALLLTLALAALRRGLPEAARPWLAVLAAVWLLPWAAAALPGMLDALQVAAPSARLDAAAAALAAAGAPHLPHPAATLAVLGVLATVCGSTPRPAPRSTPRPAPLPRIESWLAAGVAAAAALPEAATNLGMMPLSPAQAWGGVLPPRPAAVGAVLHALGMALAPLIAVAAARLYLAAPRRGA